MLRIANCSGFYGDRQSAALEMVSGGPIDVLTGDWLAELTMGLLMKDSMRDPASGYARTFLAQCEDVLELCMERRIKIVSNAGGINPLACAERVREIGAERGLRPRIAVVLGDDLTEDFDELVASGWQAAHQVTGVPFEDAGMTMGTANAYLGGRGIAAALTAGADVVITGRVADASLVVGPGAWHYGWRFDDWDALAGAVAAGHVIECGAQVTGGNFSFFDEIADMRQPGFPLAEIAADGSSVITKHPGTGGAVTVETVTAQLLYEIQDDRYLHPDVVLRMDSIRLEQAGADRVSMHSIKGEPAPDTLKVGVVCRGGWRAATTFWLPGTRAEAKAKLAEDALWAAIPGGRSAFTATRSTLLAGGEVTVREGNSQGSFAMLRVAVAAETEQAAGLLSRASVGIALANYPGLFFADPPGRPREYVVFWPTLLDRTRVHERVSLDGVDVPIDANIGAAAVAGEQSAPVSPRHEVGAAAGQQPEGCVLVLVQFGDLFGTRSGDKGGTATLGIWARDQVAYSWLASWVSDHTLAEILPSRDACRVQWSLLPNLCAVIVNVPDFLHAGVDANLDLDAQAKALGEYVRSRYVNVPDHVAALAGDRA